jgi:hypothetical protein
MSRRLLQFWITVSVVLGTVAYAVAEDTALFTSYPSPRGVYQRLIVDRLRLTNGPPAAGYFAVSADAAGGVTWSVGGPALAGMIAMFDGPCPAGWGPAPGLSGTGRMIRAGGAYGGVGGATPHAHTVTVTRGGLDHWHFMDDPPPIVPATNWGGAHNHWVNIDHQHDLGAAILGTNSGPADRSDAENDWDWPGWGHTHDIWGWTDVGGGWVEATAGGSDHEHFVPVDLPVPNMAAAPGWAGGDPTYPAVAPATDWPDFFMLNFCRKN